jgi:hypothetical protein
MFNGDDCKQKISAGDSTCNIQLSNVVLQQSGLSYEDVKSICKDLMYDNFIKLRGEALAAINERLDTFISRFLSCIDLENPLHIKNLKLPSIHKAIFMAQQAYVLSEKSELEYYIALLQETLNVDHNVLKQIIISEAIGKIGLLTEKHLQILKVLSEITIMRPNKCNLEEVICYYERIIEEVNILEVNDKDITHLLYTNCVVTYGAAMFLFSDIFKKALNVNNTGINPESLSDSDLQNIIDKSSRLKKVEKSWNNSNLSPLVLTSVGRVVALAKWNSDNPNMKFDYDEIM